MQTFVFSFPGLTVKMCSFIRALASWTQLKEPKTVFHDFMQLFVKLTECLVLCFSCETDKKNEKERKKEMTCFGRGIFFLLVCFQSKLACLNSRQVHRGKGRVMKFMLFR